MKKILKSIYKFFVVKRAKQAGNNLRVNGFSVVTPHTILKDNVNFNGMRISGMGNVIIGNNFHSGRGCNIITDFHNYDKGEAIPYDNTYIVKDISIEDNVWLGINVTVLGGVTLGEGSIIQAGSVVVKDIPPCAVAGGHPATVFKYRDIEHYKKLKSEGRFF